MTSLVQTVLAEHPSATTVAAGSIVYYIFKRYEPDTPLPLLGLLGAIPGALSAVLYLASPCSLLYTVTTAFALYYTTIVACTLAYRVSPFHPLAKYPGPFLHKLSKFRMAYVLLARKEHLGVDITYFKKLHEKYGRYVRIGMK